MPGFTDTNLGGLILNVYSKDAIQRLQNLSSPFLASLRNAPSFTVGGNGFFFGIKAHGNEAIGFRDSNQALPTAGRENVQQAKVSPRSLYGVVQVTGLAKSLATGQPSSFASVISYSLDEVTDELTQYMEGALFRDNTGKLAQVNESSPSGTTLDVDTPGGLFLRPNMVVDFFNSSGTKKASATVSSVDWANSQIVTDSDVSSSLADNDGIYLTGTQVDGSIAAKEFDGLASGTATSGTYLNISRSSFPRWQGNTITASASLDEDLLERAKVRVMQESGLSRANMRNFKIVMHYNQLRKFKEVAYPRQRFNGTDVAMGATRLTWDGHDIMDVPFCPETDVYCLDISVFNKFVTANGDLQISTDFGQPWKFVPGFDSGQAYLRFYGNYVLRNPRRAVRLQSLTDVASR